MTQEQYIKILERELARLNREIDLKIISGVNYSKEAGEHKLLLKKMRQHRIAKRKSFFKSLLTRFYHDAMLQS